MAELPVPGAVPVPDLLEVTEDSTLGNACISEAEGPGGGVSALWRGEAAYV
jgi:hypothetical protein